MMSHHDYIINESGHKLEYCGTAFVTYIINEWRLTDKLISACKNTFQSLLFDFIYAIIFWFFKQHGVIYGIKCFC